MAHARAWIEAQVQAHVDGGPDLDLRVGLGDPATRLLVRDETVDAGQAFAEGGNESFLGATLHGIAAYLDAASPSWAQVATGPLPVPPAPVVPVVEAGFGVASAAKDLGATTLTVSFGPAYANDDYFVDAVIVGQASMVEVVSRAVGSCDLRFRDSGGSIVPLVDLTVLVRAVGQR